MSAGCWSTAPQEQRRTPRAPRPPGRSGRCGRARRPAARGPSPTAASAVAQRPQEPERVLLTVGLERIGGAAPAARRAWRRAGPARRRNSSRTAFGPGPRARRRPSRGPGRGDGPSCDPSPLAAAGRARAPDDPQRRGLAGRVVLRLGVGATDRSRPPRLGCPASADASRSGRHVAPEGRTSIEPGPRSFGGPSRRGGPPRRRRAARCGHAVPVRRPARRLARRWPSASSWPTAARRCCGSRGPGRRGRAPDAGSRARRRRLAGWATPACGSGDAGFGARSPRHRMAGRRADDDVPLGWSARAGRGLPADGGAARRRLARAPRVRELARDRARPGRRLALGPPARAVSGRALAARGLGPALALALGRGGVDRST